MSSRDTSTATTPGLRPTAAPAETTAGQSQPQLPQGQRILLLSYSLPPALIGSAAIVHHLSQEFSADEMILAGAAWPGESDLALANSPPVYRLQNAWQSPRRGNRFLRPIRWLWLPWLIWQIVRLCRQHNCQWLVVVFPDEYFLLAGYLAAKISGRPFFPYFHNTYRDNRRRLPLLLARWLEPRVFRLARKVFVISAGLQRHFERKYPTACIVPLVHSFHGDLDDPCERDVDSSRLRIALLGSLNHSNMDAILRFMDAFRDEEAWELTVYSGTPSRAFVRYGIAGPRVTVASKSPDELPDALRRHDILFLPHGLHGGLSDVEYETIFPTRTIPYLISGRPIVAHSPAGAFLTDFLIQHDCAEVVVEPDAEKLRAAITRLSSDARRRRTLVENATAAAQQFRGPVVAAELRRQLLESS